jgi:preprotein translocase subunit YajC
VLRVPLTRPRGREKATRIQWRACGFAASPVPAAFALRVRCLFLWSFPVFISSAFAQTAPAAAAGGDMMSTLTGMLPLVLMFVVLYFVMIRPQMKRQKEHRAMVEAIAVGDEVVIGGGMLGRIKRLSEQYLHVEIASGVEVQVQRASLVQVLPKGTIK